MGECQDPRALGPHLRTSTSLLPHGCNFAPHTRPPYSTTTWWTRATVHSRAFGRQISISQALTSLSIRRKTRPVAKDLLQPSCRSHLHFGRDPSAPFTGFDGLLMRSQHIPLPSSSSPGRLSSLGASSPSVTPSVMSTLRSCLWCIPV